MPGTEHWYVLGDEAPLAPKTSRWDSAAVILNAESGRPCYRVMFTSGGRVMALHLPEAAAGETGGEEEEASPRASQGALTQRLQSVYPSFVLFPPPPLNGRRGSRSNELQCPFESVRAQRLDAEMYRIVNELEVPGRRTPACSAHASLGALSRLSLASYALAMVLDLETRT